MRKLQRNALKICLKKNHWKIEGVKIPAVIGFKGPNESSPVSRSRGSVFSILDEVDEFNRE